MMLLKFVSLYPCNENFLIISPILPSNVVVMTNPLKVEKKLYVYVIRT